MSETPTIPLADGREPSRNSGEPFDIDVTTMVPLGLSVALPFSEFRTKRRLLPLSVQEFDRFNARGDNSGNFPAPRKARAKNHTIVAAIPILVAAVQDQGLPAD